MTCLMDSCTQGRKPCPDPAACAGLCQNDGGAQITHGQVTRRDAPELMSEGPLEWIEDMWLAFITGCKWIGCFVFLVFVLGAAGALVNNWPQIVAALSH